MMMWPGSHECGRPWRLWMRFPRWYKVCRRCGRRTEGMMVASERGEGIAMLTLTYRLCRGV